MAIKTKRLTASDELLQRLCRIEVKAPTVVTCYLRLDQAARQNQAYLVDLLNRIKELEATFASRGLDPASEAAVRSDLERIVRQVARPNSLPDLPGVAIFAARGLELFEVVPLARVHRNRIDFDTRPLLHELLDAQESLGHYLAVIVDRQHARFFHVTAAHTEELAGMVPITTRGGKFHSDRGNAPGWGEFRYHQRIEAEKNRHYAAVARELGRLAHARPYRGLAIFGPREHTMALEGFLPAWLHRLMVGSGRLNPTSATTVQVARASWRLQWESERRGEAEVVDRVEGGVPNGRAVNGARETLRALARGQVRELIIPDGATGGGFRCRGSQALALSKIECRGAGEPEPVPNLVDHAIEDALRQRVQVVVIDDPAIAARIDGLAATLRFKSR